MVKHITENTDHIAISDVTINITSGTFVCPVSGLVPDVSEETIEESSTALDGEVRLIPASGILLVASGSNTWFGLELE